jgi:hypothetical protein
MSHLDEANLSFFVGVVPPHIKLFSAADGSRSYK